MTYTIAPDSPKALKARAFGDELVKALKARNVPLKEVARAVGISHTAIDHYRVGSILPKTATAGALAEALDWPKLALLVEQARTFRCERPGCSRTYRHEGGGPRKYCTPLCVRQAEAQRAGSTRLRQAGQTGDGRLRAAAIAQLRSAARIADERAQLAEGAIAAMCADCEPVGLCRQPECPLRSLSPLPLAGETREPRTHAEIRVDLNRKAAPKRSATMKRRWADPDWHDRQVAASVAGRQRMTPERVAERNAHISAAKKGQPSQPWSEERRAAQRAGIAAAAERRRLEATA